MASKIHKRITVRER